MSPNLLQNHTVLSYSTTDFTNWNYLGVALSLDARREGTEFRPQVIYNPTSQLFIMWWVVKSPDLHSVRVRGLLLVFCTYYLLYLLPIK